MMAEPARKLSPEAEFAARRRKRSVALGLVLAALVAILYALTIVKFGPAIFDRAI